MVPPGHLCLFILVLTACASVARPGWERRFQRASFADETIASRKPPSGLAIQTAPDILANENGSPFFRPETYEREKDSQPQKFYMDHSWGKFSPFYALESGTFGLPKASHVAPDGCTINAVHILLRHGARYPSSSLPDFVEKIEKAKKDGTFKPTGQFNFLELWSYDLGEKLGLAGNLTKLGRQELYFFRTGHPCPSYVSSYHSSTGITTV
jgi:hypothetical protein